MDYSYYVKQKGISYIEIVVVVIILGIVSVIALPNLSSTDPKKLEIAMEEVIQAIRFSRLESIRTGIPHGVFINKNDVKIKVYRLLAGTPTYDIYHPVDKKIYTLNLKTDRATEGVDLLNHSINFQGIPGNKNYLGFSKQGIPKYSYFGSDHMLTNSATITLSYAGLIRVISISPMIGRVTIQ